ncbi:hypothetical protein F5X99DRAFT_263587 [Biscogniauxia marginata]|nr:hypothetical protein F5X99DRAFT_263587 [Biscogniauxia marginata]
MPWATNPLFKPEEAGEPKDKNSTDLESAKGSSAQQAPKDTTTKAKTGFRTPSKKFTTHQIFYIFILDGIGAAVLSGGINFAVAYAMYFTQDATKPIRLFQFPNTLAGDAAVTVIIQCLITWHIELLIVNRDLKKGGVQPIGFLPEPKWSWLRWFMFLDREEQTHPVRSFVHWLLFLWSQIIRALLVAVVVFPFIWGPSLGFLVLVGRKSQGDWWYEKVWIPEIFKLVQGAVLGLLTTPLMVMFWLARCGWALRNNEAHYGER